MYIAGARGQTMKRERNRDYRRSVRARAVSRAFDVYWNSWGYWENRFRSRFDQERVILEQEHVRWDYENQHRLDVLTWAKQRADNMCWCSCLLCTGYKKYEKTTYDLREIERDIDAALDFNDAIWE